MASAFVLFVHLSANTMEFSQHNIGWNGTSSFFSDLDRHRSTEITDPAKLAGSPRNSTLLIIAPDRHPTDQELAAYSAFLDEGNTIVLADDFGTGNEILAGLGSRISILPGNLSSFDHKYNDPSTVIAFRAPGESPFSLPVNITLNGPAALNGGTPLILTTVFSWIDTNGDGRLNKGETMGTFPVMAYEYRGNGRIIVLSDPSIFINSMYSANANDRELTGALTPDGPVLIDQRNSRTADTNGFSEILHVIRTTGTIEIFMLCLLALILALAWNKKMI
jgi:hypothetical protein